MTTPNTELVRRCFDEIFNEGLLEVIDEIVDPDFINFGRRRGQEGLKVIVAVWRTAFPDVCIRIEEELAADDRVMVRVTCSGTHRAELRHLTMGVIPATGKYFSVEHIHIFRIGNGRIVEHRACRDDLGMLQQLGWIATPETPSEESRAALLQALVA
jgi:predicted ester cyclase